MINNEFKKLLALLLINKDQLFRTSYQLCKVLAWKFKIIEFVDLTNDLLTDGLITRKIIKGIGHFNITNRGLDFLKTNEDYLYKKLKGLYPEEEEFIEGIWNSIDIGNQQ